MRDVWGVERSDLAKADRSRQREEAGGAVAGAAGVGGAAALHTRARSRQRARGLREGARIAGETRDRSHQAAKDTLEGARQYGISGSKTDSEIHSAALRHAMNRNENAAGAAEARQHILDAAEHAGRRAHRAGRAGAALLGVGAAGAGLAAYEHHKREGVGKGDVRELAGEVRANGKVARARMTNAWQKAKSGQFGVGGPMVVGADDVAKAHSEVVHGPLHTQRRREARLSQLDMRRGAVGKLYELVGVEKAKHAAPGTAGSSSMYHLPKHSDAWAKVTQPATPKPKPLAAAIRGTLRPTAIR